MARIKKEDRNFVFDNPITLNIKYYIKRIVYFFYAVLCHIALRLRRKKKSEGKKYQVSICAIFKNEAKYLKEWIEFHRIIGVEHFYLYNNNSDDNYLDVLKTYVEQGIVDLIEWPFAQGQISAYRHCVKNDPLPQATRMNIEVIRRKLAPLCIFAGKSYPSAAHHHHKSGGHNDLQRSS